MPEIEIKYTEPKYALRDELKTKIDEIFELVEANKTRELVITSRISAGEVEVEYEIKGMV